MKRNLLWLALGCGAVMIAVLVIGPWRPPANEAIVDADTGEESEDSARGPNQPAPPVSEPKPEPDAPPEVPSRTALDEAMLAEANAKYAQMMELDRQNLKEEAIEMAEEVLAVRLRILGEQHLDYALTANYLAQEYAKSGDDEQAAPLYENAQVAVASIVDQLETGISQSQQISLRGSMQFIQDNYLGFLFRTGGDPAEAYEAVLHWKGAILVRQRAARLAAESGKAAEILLDVQKVVHDYTTLASASPEEEGEPERKAQRDQLASRKESLEGRLSQEGASILKQTSALSVNDIQAALPENAALIDYSVRWFNEPSAENPGILTRRQALIAFVVRRTGRVQMFDLGAAEAVFAAIETWRATYGSSTSGKRAGDLLRQKLWAPLEPAIGNAELVLVSPDGPLGKLPFAALPGSRPDTYLIEDLAVAVIPVPLLLPQLVAPAPPTQLPRHLLVVGGVDYDHRAESAGPMIASSAPAPILPWEHRGAPTFAGKFPAWKRMKGMASEARSIAGLYRKFMQLPENSEKVVFLEEGNATEEAFCQMASECRLLHLATHGYFVAGRGYGPGLMSGLVLSGANLPMTLPDDPGQLATMPSDGYLTAEEISFLSLGGAQLVVLSACDSGLGEIALGEGPLGIQRAFQVAGARATIATLWKVDDEMTSRLMEEFYSHYLEPDPALHLAPLEALRAAQLWALNTPNLDPRAADLPPDAGTVRRLPPQYWAAFTLSGDWR